MFSGAFSLEDGCRTCAEPGFNTLPIEKVKKETKEFEKKINLNIPEV